METFESKWSIVDCKVPDRGCHSSPQIRWWKLEVRDAGKLKKESWLAWGTPEAANGYQEAKCAADQAAVERKIGVWERFEEALEEDCGKKF